MKRIIVLKSLLLTIFLALLSQYSTAQSCSEVLHKLDTKWTTSIKFRANEFTLNNAIINPSKCGDSIISIDAKIIIKTTHLTKRQDIQLICRLDGTSIGEDIRTFKNSTADTLKISNPSLYILPYQRNRITLELNILGKNPETAPVTIEVQPNSEIIFAIKS